MRWEESPASAFFAKLALSWVLVWVLVLAPASALAGEYRSVIEAGVGFHTGKTDKSAPGALGFSNVWRAELRKGTFRPSLSARFDYVGGKASVGGATPAFMSLGGIFGAGIQVYLFKEAPLMPFLGGHGLLGARYFQMTSPPSGVEGYTQGIAYGFELSPGVDIHFGGADGWALRMRAGYFWCQSSVAGVSGFQFTNFHFTFGIAY